MNKLYIFLLLTIGLQYTATSQVHGHYSKTNSEGSMTSTEICFNNGRFEYIWSSDLADFSCKGSYLINNDTIALNSDIKLKDLIQVKQLSINPLDSVYISLSTVSQTLPFDTRVIINDSSYYSIDYKKTPLLVFPKNYIKKLSVESSNVSWKIRNFDFNIKQSTSIIEIIIDDTRGIWRVYFDNERFLIENNRLISVNDSNYQFINNPNAKCK